jgi:hypothetical protein
MQNVSVSSLPILVILPTPTAKPIQWKIACYGGHALLSKFQILLILGNVEIRLGGAVITLLMALISGFSILLSVIGLIGRSWTVLLGAGLIALGAGTLSIFSIGSLFIALAFVDICVAGALRTRAGRMGWILAPPMIVLGWLGVMRLLLLFDGPTRRGLVAMAVIAVCISIFVIVGFGRFADRSTD